MPSFMCEICNTAPVTQNDKMYSEGIEILTRGKAALIEAQRQDARKKATMHKVTTDENLAKRFQVKNEILYYGAQKDVPTRFFIPKVLKKTLLMHYHAMPTAGHFGYRKTLARIIANWVERVNRNIKAMLQAYSSQDHRTWDLHIDEMQSALNSAKHDTLQCSPAEIFLGRKLDTPIDKVLREVEETIIDLGQIITNTQVASKNKQYYAKQRQSPKITLKAQVLLKTHIVADAAKNVMSKLAPRYEGPYTVTRILSPVG